MMNVNCSRLLLPLLVIGICALSVFAATCPYTLDATKFDFGIDCASGTVELIEGRGLRLACPSGGSETAGVWIQSKMLEAKTFSSEAAFEAWQAPLTNRRLALRVLLNTTAVAHAAHMPQPALLGSPSVLAVNSSNFERWVDLGQGGMWQSGSLTGGYNSGMSKVVVSAKAKGADGLVKTAEATSMQIEEALGGFLVRLELTAAAVSTEAFEVVLASFGGAGWGGATFSTLTCGATTAGSTTGAETASIASTSTLTSPPTNNNSNIAACNTWAMAMSCVIAAMSWCCVE